MVLVLRSSCPLILQPNSLTAMAYRALVVDDEPLARKMIVEYLSAFDEVEVIGQCENGRQAVARINTEKPDLVFLHVQMPGLDGFEVVQQLEHIPSIIFSTAFDQYALRAFEAGAIDYLLKPYDRDRFEKAIQRVLDRLQKPDDAFREAGSVAKVLQQRGALSNVLFVRVRGRIVPVQLADVEWIEAAGDYATLHAGSEAYLSSQNLGWFEKNLDAQRFVRVHRSAIVAVDAITHIRSDGEGGYVATMRAGATVRISRSYAGKVRALIV